MSELSKLMDAYDLRKIEDITDQANTVLETMEKDFPEADCRLEVNWDRVHGQMHWKFTVISGEEATPTDRRLVTIRRTLGRKEFLDEPYMDKFIKNFSKDILKEITGEMNEQYQIEKGRSGLIL